MNKVPEPLQNAVPEYTVSDKIKAMYEEELQTWSDIIPPGMTRTTQGLDPSDGCCTAKER